MPVLDELRLFLQVADAGTLSAVGTESGTSQSAISQRIRRLEREFGVSLFERGRRGVLLTPEGRVLLEAARSAVAAVDQARREIVRLATGEAGVLRVATGGTTLRHFMTKPLAAFRRHHAGVAFEYVSVNSTSQCIGAIRQDRADLAYITITSTQEVEQRPAVRTRWVLVTRDDDPLAERQSLRPRDLDNIRAIALPGSTSSRSQLADQLSAHGVQHQVAATVDDWDTAVLLAEIGVGHALVPAMWVHDLDRHRRLRAIPIDGLTPVTFGWAARRWSSLPTSAHTFVAAVNEGVANLGRDARIELLAWD
jgi:DNA-binding transcriptional LysR family regulator